MITYLLIGCVWTLICLRSLNDQVELYQYANNREIGHLTYLFCVFIMSVFWPIFLVIGIVSIVKKYFVDRKANKNEEEK